MMFLLGLVNPLSVFAAGGGEHREAAFDLMQELGSVSVLREGVERRMARYSDGSAPASLQQLAQMSDHELGEVLVPAYMRVWDLEQTQTLLAFFRSVEGQAILHGAMLAGQGREVALTQAEAAALNDFAASPTGAIFIDGSRRLGAELNAQLRTVASNVMP